MESTYQSDKKCPRCKKRTVYVQLIMNVYYFICRACGHQWKS